MVRWRAGAERPDLLGRHLLHRRQAHLVERLHGALRHDAGIRETLRGLVCLRERLALVLLSHLTPPDISVAVALSAMDVIPRCALRDGRATRGQKAHHLSLTLSPLKGGEGT